MSGRLRVGVVGVTGRPGMNHLESMYLPVLESAGLDAVSIWVPDSASESQVETAHHIGRLYSLPVFQGGAPPEDIDGAIVCAVGEQLVEIASWAGEKDLPVFVDKPTLTSTDDLERIAAVAPNLRIIPGHHLRWSEGVQEAVRRVRSAQIGLLRTVVVDMVSTAGEGASQTGDLRNLGVYQVDIIEALLGSVPDSVQGFFGDIGGGGESWTYVAQGAHDVIVSGHISRTVPEPGTTISQLLGTLRVQGTHGMLAIDLGGPTYEVNSIAARKQVPYTVPSTGEAMRVLASSIRSGSSPYGLARLLSVSRFLDAIAQSSSTHNPATTRNEVVTR